MLASFIKICGAYFATASLTLGVSYISKTLVKSCKLIPVMAMLVLIGHKTYSTSKYILVSVITLGILLFFTSMVSD